MVIKDKRKRQMMRRMIFYPHSAPENFTPFFSPPLLSVFVSGKLETDVMVLVSRVAKKRVSKHKASFTFGVSVPRVCFCDWGCIVFVCALYCHSVNRIKYVKSFASLSYAFTMRTDWWTTDSVRLLYFFFSSCLSAFVTRPRLQMQC